MNIPSSPSLLAEATSEVLAFVFLLRLRPGPSALLCPGVIAVRPAAILTTQECALLIDIHYPPTPPTPLTLNCHKHQSLSLSPPIPPLIPERPINHHGLLHQPPIQLNQVHLLPVHPPAAQGGSSPGSHVKTERHAVKTSALLFTQGPLPGIRLCETCNAAEGALLLNFILLPGIVSGV